MDDNDVKRHPLPQNVSGYEFRLVGNMTLKQFGELALGIILAFICWSLPIVSFFKYLLVGFFALLGFGLAFMPINEQPLDKWIINFFRSVYSPTQYLWQKASVVPDFLEKSTLAPLPPEPQKATPVVDRKKLEEYLQTVPLETELVSEPIDLSLDETPPPATEAEPPPNPPTGGPATRLHLLPTSEEGKVELPEDKSLKPEPAVQAKASVKATADVSLLLPTIPNILSGMVLDNQGKILTDAMLEVRDKNGFPVRAFKANKLGRFSIATPLKNGFYELEIEKNGYQFDLIKFQAEGEVIEPLKIQARGRVV